MVYLALQENGLFIDTEKSDDRGPPALSSEEGKTLWVFPLQEKGSPKNLRGNDCPLSSTTSKFDLYHGSLLLTQAFDSMTSYLIPHDGLVTSQARKLVELLDFKVTATRPVWLRVKRVT